ncbi:MAG: hypothetical protein CM15mP86_14510 [Gammaproteobacteria bacterium]|nr:MAG: hypothetical protein CM15mP86_14510 [Gammaproteobacteria bacterium]
MSEKLKFHKDGEENKILDKYFKNLFPIEKKIMRFIKKEMTEGEYL